MKPIFAACVLYSAELSAQSKGIVEPASGTAGFKTAVTPLTADSGVIRVVGHVVRPDGLGACVEPCRAEGTAL